MEYKQLDSNGLLWFIRLIKGLWILISKLDKLQFFTKKSVTFGPIQKNPKLQSVHQPNPGSF